MAQARRVALALPDDVDEVLLKFSQVTGMPKTAIITQFLIDAMPIMTQVIQAMHQAKKGQTDLAIHTAAKFLNQAQMNVSQAHLELGELKGKHGKT